MSMNKIPSDWKNCGTCSRWCGRQIPDAFNTFVEFNMNETGKCSGGGFNQSKMPPMASCNQWVQRFKR